MNHINSYTTYGIAENVEKIRKALDIVRRLAKAPTDDDIGKILKRNLSVCPIEEKDELVDTLILEARELEEL